MNRIDILTDRIKRQAFPKPNDFYAIGVRVRCDEHDLFVARTLDDARDAVQYLRALAALYDALGKEQEMGSPTTVSELRRLLDAKREARVALYALVNPGLPGHDIVEWKRTYYRLRDVDDDLHIALTDDTVAAMLTALEAAKKVVQRLRVPDEFGMVEACVYDLAAALTRLEATDE